MVTGLVEVFLPFLAQVVVVGGLDRLRVDLDATAFGFQCLQQQFVDLFFGVLAGHAVSPG
ncbi:hypothetical protein D3C83_138550 [compost metagenome]